MSKANKSENRKTYPPNQIRRYRKKVHFKLKDVALLMGEKSPACVSHYEKGNKLPSLTNAIKLAKIVKCPVELLFGDLSKQISYEVFERKKKYKLFERYS